MTTNIDKVLAAKELCLIRNIKELVHNGFTKVEANENIIESMIDCLVGVEIFVNELEPLVKEMLIDDTNESDMAS